MSAYAGLIESVNHILDHAEEYFRPESTASSITFNRPEGGYRVIIEKCPPRNLKIIANDPSITDLGPRSIGGVSDCGCPPGHPCCMH